MSADELCEPAWAMHPEKEWTAQDDNSCIAGEFVWTGFGYLGEPTPYYSEWASRSSYFGIFDEAQRCEVKTAGESAAIRLQAEQASIRADGDDLVYVIASVGWMHSVRFVLMPITD